MPSPPPGRNTTPPRFPGSLVSAIKQRAGRLGLKANVYLSVLVHNDLALRTALKLRAGKAKIGAEKRVRFPLSMPIKLRKEGAERAERAGGTFTAYIEELVTRDLAKGGALSIIEVPDTVP